MTRTKEFIDGFEACDRGISRSRNPYLKDAIIAAGDADENKQYLDWHDGWSKRFYGEDIFSAP